MAIAPVFLLILIGVGVAGVLALRVLVRPRATAKPAQPCCAACGYLVRGLPTFICPECGMDLREVGIRTPQMHRTMGPWGWVVVWSILLPLAALIISAIVGDSLFRYGRQRSQITLNSPRSGAYSTISINAAGTGRGYPVGFDQVTMVIVGPGGKASKIEVDLPGLAHEYVDASGQRVSKSSGLDGQTILDWMAAAGVESSGPQVAQEAGGLAAMLQLAAAGGGNLNTPGGFSGSSSSSSSGLGPHPLFAPIALGFWLLVWGAGVWRILHGRREKR